MTGLTHYALEILVSKFRYKIISIYNTKTKWAYSVVNHQLERAMYAWSALSCTHLRSAKTINHHIETGLFEMTCRPYNLMLIEAARAQVRWPCLNEKQAFHDEDWKKPKAKLPWVTDQNSTQTEICLKFTGALHNWKFGFTSLNWRCSICYMRRYREAINLNPIKKLILLDCFPLLFILTLILIFESSLF